MLIQLIPSFDIGYRQRVCLLYSKSSYSISYLF